VNAILALMTENNPSPDYSRPQFPPHNKSRVWVITAGDSPIGISVARQILAHGDSALVGITSSDLDRDACRRDMFEDFQAEVEAHRDEGWLERFKAVRLDIRCAFDLIRRLCERAH
jgi:NAD(P)-dependent dehydrogenase (short-subunit alcohol dehydrogenase family)